MSKTYVGLMILTQDEGNEPVVILQRRGAFDYEKNMPESFAGVCQVTAHGQADGDESPEEALLREVEEELGKTAAATVRREFSRIKEVGRTEIDDKVRITYTLTLPTSFVQEIHLHKSSSGLVLIKKSELCNVQGALPEYREHGVPAHDCIFMFPDEKSALERLF